MSRILSTGGRAWHTCPLLPCTPPTHMPPAMHTPCHICSLCHAHPSPATHRPCHAHPPLATHAVNDRAVRILLECILVKDFYIVLLHFHFNLAGYCVTCTLTFREPWIISKKIRYIDTEFSLSQLPQQWQPKFNISQTRYSIGFTDWESPPTLANWLSKKPTIIRKNINIILIHYSSSQTNICNRKVFQ